MPILGDNPSDDGLDFAGCLPKTTRLKLPKFAEKLEDECRLICSGRCAPFPDRQRDGDRKEKGALFLFQRLGGDWEITRSSKFFKFSLMRW